MPASLSLTGLDSGRSARRWVFPLLATLQLVSVAAVVVHLLLDDRNPSEAELDFETYVLPFTPLLWLALSGAGVVSLLVWRTGRARTVARVGTWVWGVSGLLGGTGLTLGLLLVLSYGAHFDHPSVPPTPAFATVVARADGSDDDNPMRGRESVIDVGEHTEGELVAFYRETFPGSAGWSEGTAGADDRDDASVCLVNNEKSGYDEYVEVYPHDDGVPSGGPGRFLVSITRFSVVSGGGERPTDRCGLAQGYFQPPR